jgi:hypothetical protein
MSQQRADILNYFWDDEYYINYYIWLIINQRSKQCILLVPNADEHFSRQVTHCFCRKLLIAKSESNQPLLWAFGILPYLTIVLYVMFLSHNCPLCCVPPRPWWHSTFEEIIFSDGQQMSCLSGNLIGHYYVHMDISLHPVLFNETIRTYPKGLVGFSMNKTIISSIWPSLQL